jgi:Uma2 family endonuclease
MATALPKGPSIADLLAWERTQPERHECIDGLVRAMTGGTAAHNRIVKNLAAAFRAALRGTSCEEFIESMKVVTAFAFTYPDVVVTCSPVIQGSDVVPEPVLIVEVLSPGTQAWDRSGKWQAYQTIPSLVGYLLVAQDEPRVERYARGTDGWSYQVFEGLDSTIGLTQPATTLRLAEIYERFDFPSVRTARL